MSLHNFIIVRAEALEQLRASKNLFVKSVAQLVLKTFKRQTIPGTPGMKGAPGIKGAP